MKLGVGCEYSAPNNFTFIINKFVIFDEMIDLYLVLSNKCEIINNNLVCNHYILEQALITCKYIRVGHLWIYAPGSFIQNPYFLEKAKKLAELYNNNYINKITLQSYRLDFTTISNISQVLQNFNLSLMVCESPLCGADLPNEIIRTYLKMKDIFKSVSLVGPSPLTCIYGINAGTGLRRKCLVQKNLLFVMNNGQVKVCPLGHYKHLGELKSDSLHNILTKYMKNNMKFPIKRLKNSKVNKFNICFDCLWGKNK